MNKNLLVFAFIANAFAQQLSEVEVRASMIVPETDSLSWEFKAPVATVAATVCSGDSQTPPEVIPTEGFPPMRCLCGTLGANFTTSTTSASAAASCLDSLLEMPAFHAEQDELLPGQVEPAPPKPPVFEQLKVPIVR